jgi:hypothetical protein
MTTQTAGHKVQLSVTVRPELKAVAKEVAKENHTTPSGIVSQYLEGLSRARKEKLMIEYYQATTKESRDFAKKSIKVIQNIASSWSD